MHATSGCSEIVLRALATGEVDYQAVAGYSTHHGNGRVSDRYYGDVQSSGSISHRHLTEKLAHLSARVAAGSSLQKRIRGLR